MKKFYFIVLFIAVLFGLANFLRADILRLDSGNFNDGTFVVGPVNMTLNGQPIEAMCISINLQSSFGSSWDIHTFNLGGNLTGFSLYDGTASSFHTLQEVGWLYTQTLHTTDTAQIAAYNQAAWILERGTDTSHDSYLFNPASAAALNLAGQQVFNASFNNSITFYQPTNSANQFFVSQIPEPTTYGMIGVGALALLGFGGWKRIKQTN